jgi:hypothetical protein
MELPNVQTALNLEKALELMQPHVEEVDDASTE